MDHSTQPKILSDTEDHATRLHRHSPHCHGLPVRQVEGTCAAVGGVPSECGRPNYSPTHTYSFLISVQGIETRSSSKMHNSSATSHIACRSTSTSVWRDRFILRTLRWTYLPSNTQRAQSTSSSSVDVSALWSRYSTSKTFASILDADPAASPQ
jgi:hypothetical protein